jgi:glycosyltransferase involved in cell wall biosynthesis/uncharacterized small protein (DUF1192 family)
MFRRNLRPRLKARVAQLETAVGSLGVAELEARIAQLEAALQRTLESILTAQGEALAGHSETLAGHSGALTGHSEALAGHAAWLQALEGGLADISLGHSAQLHDLNRWLSATTQVVTAMSTVPVIPSPELQAIGPQAQRIDERAALTRSLQVWTVMRWLRQAPMESDVLISVVVPTRNRRPYLARAIASVLAQSYSNFDLVIVDDGSTDDTPALLNAVEDKRVRHLRTAGLGTAAARNIGLDAAVGEIVTHFDDDNLMDPDWLRGVAWGFARWPDTELLYGARIIEDGAARGGLASGAMPILDWQPFDRARLETSNYIDMNVLAHRAGLPEARFDPAMRSSIEWLMLLRLTAKRAPLELPVIACLYSNYAPNRLSDRPTYVQENQLVRARVHTTRPMRVLCYNALFPLLSETYIEEEMLALEAAGAQIAFASFAQSVSPYPLQHRFFSTLEEAVAAQDPDIIVVYWTTHAIGELDHLARIGRPFALRVHSFDFRFEDVMRVKEHPCCVGIWAFPHHAKSVPDAHALAPIFVTHAAIPVAVSDRTLVASISAGLPKKDWPFLLDVMNQLAEFDRVIVLARTNGFEELPDEVTRLAAELAHPVAVKVNLPRQEVFELLSRTSVLLYTVVQDIPLGMPMSIIEALRAGACVITPDAPELRSLCGDGFRPYHNAADICVHVREIMRGGELIENERRANQEWAMQRFCDPARGQAFHDELSAAVVAWRERRQNV